MFTVGICGFIMILLGSQWVLVGSLGICRFIEGIGVFTVGICGFIVGIGVFTVSICEFIMVLLGSLSICVFIMGSCGFIVDICDSLWYCWVHCEYLCVHCGYVCVHCGIVGFTVGFWVDCGYLWEIQLSHHLLYLCFTVIILLV